ncbi:hypothetical protein THAOC_29735, partial [Thalassiosira oceanica]
MINITLSKGGPGKWERGVPIPSNKNRPSILILPSAEAVDPFLASKRAELSHGLARLASAHARQLRRQTAAAPKAREGPRKVVLGAWSIAQPMPRAAPALAVAHMSSQAVDCNALEATTSIEEITDNEHNRDTLRSLQNDELPAVWLCKPGMAIRMGDYEEFELGSSRELEWLGHFAKKSTHLEIIGISGDGAFGNCSGHSVEGFFHDLSQVEHGNDAAVAHLRPGYCSRSTPGPTAEDRRRWFGRDWCNGHGIRPDRGAPRPSYLLRGPARSSTTQHDLTPPLCRYGRSGARGPSIYLVREPDAATSIPDGAADVKFTIPAARARRNIKKMTFSGTNLAEIIDKLGGAMKSNNFTNIFVEACHLGVPEATFLFNTFRDMNSLLEELHIDGEVGDDLANLNDGDMAGCIPSLAACTGMRSLTLNYLNLSTNSCAALRGVLPRMATLRELVLRGNSL